MRTTTALGLWWTGQLQRMGNNDTRKSSPVSHADSIHHCYHNVKMESHYSYTNLLVQKNLHLPLYGLLSSCFTQWFILPLAPSRNWNSCDTPHNFSFYSLVVKKTTSQPNPGKLTVQLSLPTVTRVLIAAASATHNSCSPTTCQCILGTRLNMPLSHFGQLAIHIAFVNFVELQYDDVTPLSSTSKSVPIHSNLKLLIFYTMF